MSDFFMRTERKIVRTYAVRIVIYIAGAHNVSFVGLPVDLCYMKFIHRLNIMKKANMYA